MAEETEKAGEPAEGGDLENRKKLAEELILKGVDTEKIAAETGLKLYMVNAIKGGLVRRGQLPSRKEEEAKRREPPKAKEPEEGGAGPVPFRRPRSPEAVLDEVLTQFRVKENAKNIILNRCRRIGKLDPTELLRMLMDLDTGLRSKEAGYVADEYYLALKAEEEEEAGGPPRRYDAERRREPYPREYETEDYPRRRLDYEYGRRAWDYDYGYGYGYRGVREEPVTERRLHELLRERDREFEDMLERRKHRDELSELREMVTKLTMELKAVKENPPAAAPPDVVTKADLEKVRKDEYVEALKLQMDRLEKDRAEVVALLKEERTSHRDELKELEKTYTARIEKLEDRIREEEKKGGAVQGYKDDTLRLAGQGLERIADIIERKEPIKVLLQGVKTVPEKPPERLKVGESGVADQVPSELVE